MILSHRKKLYTLTASFATLIAIGQFKQAGSPVINTVTPSLGKAFSTGEQSADTLETGSTVIKYVWIVKLRMLEQITVLLSIYIHTSLNHVLCT